MTAGLQHGMRGTMAPMASDLDRFVAAQQATYESALAELRSGRKTGHWIWFVFPQLDGLGRSEMSHRYGIVSLAEARAYAAHPVLGARLRECAEALLATGGRTADDILGSVDAMKVRSSMTLFRRAAPDEPVFGRVLDRFYGGRPDPATETMLGSPLPDRT
jgi:uncharacterized protein (DUF1810 family)